jgi:hypothetical protein
MFVQITKEELIKETSKKAWYQTNNIIWTIIFLYPFLVLLILYTPINLATVFYYTDHYQSYYLWFTAIFTAKKYITAHCCISAFFLLSVTSAILCNIVNIQKLNHLLLAFCHHYIVF